MTFSTKEYTYVPSSKINKWKAVVVFILAPSLIILIIYVAFFAGDNQESNLGLDANIPPPPRLNVSITEGTPTPPSLDFKASADNFNRKRQQQRIEDGKMVVSLPPPGQKTQVRQSLQAVDTGFVPSKPASIKLVPQEKPAAGVTTQEQSARVAYARSLIDSWSLKKVQRVYNTETSPRLLSQNSGVLPSTEGTINNGGTDFQQDSVSKPVIQAGEFLYAESQSSANSEVPGAIRFDLIGHELGEAWVLASYERRGDYLDIKANLLILKNRPAIPINAIVTGLNGSPAVRTSVNQQYFKKYGLPAIARFIQGFGLAAAAPNQTITITGTEATIVETEGLSVGKQALVGAGEAAKVIADDLAAASVQVNPIVKLAANEPVSLFFLEDVFVQRTEQ